jgi:hypothetical protein
MYNRDASVYKKEWYNNFETPEVFCQQSTLVNHGMWKQILNAYIFLHIKPEEVHGTMQPYTANIKVNLHTHTSAQTATYSYKLELLPDTKEKDHVLCLILLYSGIS